MSTYLLRNRRSLLGRYALAGALASMTLASAVPVRAALADMSALAGAKAVDDADLGEMRGKFVRPEAVSFFGITMLTSWQDESGVTTLARLVFNVDFLSPQNGNPVPQLMIAWSREGDPAMDVAENHEGYAPYLSAEQVLPIGGLGSFNGAAQANIIAGADNRVLNGLQIAIVPSSAVPAMSSGGLQPASGTTNLAFSDGDQLQFRVADNQVGIVMSGNNGLDSSMQLMGGDIGQALQQTILNSDQNNIANSSSIIFGIDTLSGLDILRAQEALSAMKGHGL